MASVNNIRGISFPFRKGPTGVPTPVEGAEAIAQDVLLAIMVTKGTRIMRPEVGSNVIGYVFDQNNEVLPSLIRTEINSTLTRFEPRVIVTDVSIQRSDPTKPLEDQKSHVIVNITFLVKATREQQTVQLTLPTS